MDETEQNPQKISKTKVYWSKIRRRLLKHIWITRLALLLIILTPLIFFLIWASKVYKKSELGSYVGYARSFITAPSETLFESKGRTNVLVLGKAGGNHAAPDLTDTMILMSVSHESDKIDLISLPRDIWITDLRAKLNSVYYWGNKTSEGGGIALVKSVVHEITGQEVHYTVIIDFSGFEDIIDAMGGIAVNVENGFTDERYPIEGRENDECSGDPELACRYETIEFEQGEQQMSGERALKFVRSRNAQGDEGTDLARGQRQQKVIMAMKQKALSKEILLNPKRLKSLYKAIDSSVVTDIKDNEMPILLRHIYDARDNITSHVLGEEYLENPPILPQYDNLYVFIPKHKDPQTGQRSWKKVQQWIDSILR